MDLLEELRWRGLIYDIINEEELKERLKKPITLYCGFDPTAPSMHIGSLLPIVTLMRFRKAGHNIIALTGGGTGLVGDPSGKKSERSLNSTAIVANWAALFKEQFSRFIKFDDKTAFSIDNSEWLLSLKAIDMWRDYGKYFPINYMLAKDCVKSRLENGLTYLEFSYMIMQSIDFLKMYQNPKLHCEMQIGGQDQWGNITAGMELIRRIEGTDAKVFGLTLPLVVKSDGTKFGKTESGAIWLDKKKTSPYEMYQFFINTADSDVIKYLKYFTFLKREEIEVLEQKVVDEPHLREAQKTLASEVVRMVHGQAELDHAIMLTQALFSGNIKELNVEDIKDCFKGAPSIESKEETNIIDSLINLGAAKSKREAREFITNGAISINGNIVKDLDYTISEDKAIGNLFTIVRKGKKNYYLIKH